MVLTNPAKPPPTYPLPHPDEDPNFNVGLLIEVAEVLAKHSYPPIAEGADLVRLQQALFGFLYGPA